MERHRIDVWLKLTCIFKQRSEATQACDGGHVRLNGARAKPASPVKVGDIVEVIGERYRKLIVQGLPERTIAKAEARTMYDDVTPKVEIDKSMVQERDRGAGRPTKRDRREIDRWKR